MTNSQIKYSDYEYNALGYFLKQQMFGVELTEQEQIEAAMAILKFGEIEIPEVEDDLQPIEINEKWGVISKNGWIAFPIYDDVGYFKEGFAEVQRADEKYNHINTKGELLSKKWWVEAGFFYEGFAWVQRTDGKWNHINTKGEILSKKWWQLVGDFKEGFAWVQRTDGKQNHTNTNGELLSEEWWEWAESFTKDFAEVERVNGKEGYIDKEGNFYDELPN